MGSKANIPPPPPGFELVPPPPPGFELVKKQDAAPAAAPAKPEERGLLGKIWDVVNTPVADFVLPEGVTTADIFKAAMFQKLGLGEYIPGVNDERTLAHAQLGDTPSKAAVRAFVAGSAGSTGEMGAGATSPLGITLAAAGPATKLPGAVGTLAKATTTGAGLGFGVKGAGDVLEATSEGTLTPENVEKGLQGAAMVAGGAAAVRATGPAVVRSTKAAATRAIDAARPVPKVSSLIPEAAQLPPKARTGAESVFRASAPTGGNPQFRANLYTAAGDLAEIGRKLSVKSSAGGVMRPDLRVRAVVKAMNEHLHEMYQTERLPQIQRNSQAPVKLTLDADAASGLKQVQRVGAGEANRNLALRVGQADTVPLADLDQLARVVNKELVDLNSMTASERALKLGTNRRLADLQALDRQLKEAINTELANRGEVGVSLYERRFAGLSGVRDQLQTRMNAVELTRKIPLVNEVRSAVFGGKSGVASASQAAVADVNIGRALETGLRLLAESGVKPNRGIAPPAPKVRGLLPSGAAQLPPSSAAGPGSAPPPVFPGTRATRKGLLLPERTSIDLPERSGIEPLAPGAEGALPARSILVRDRKGNLRRMYLTEAGETVGPEPIYWLDQP